MIDTRGLMRARPWSPGFDNRRRRPWRLRLVLLLRLGLRGVAPAGTASNPCETYVRVRRDGGGGGIDPVRAAPRRASGERASRSSFLVEALSARSHTAHGAFRARGRTGRQAILSLAALPPCRARGLNTGRSTHTHIVAMSEEGAAISVLSMERRRGEGEPGAAAAAKSASRRPSASAAADLNFEGISSRSEQVEAHDAEALSELEGRGWCAQASKRMKVEGGKGAKQRSACARRRPPSRKDTAHLLGGSAVGVTPRRGALIFVGIERAEGRRRARRARSRWTRRRAVRCSSRQDAGKVVSTFNPKPRRPIMGGDVEGVSVLRGRGGRGRRLRGGLEQVSGIGADRTRRARLLDAQVARSRRLDGRDGFTCIASVVATGPDEVTVVGRVCCEGEGKLNMQSIFLEGSRATSGARRVRLDLTDCPEFALFPGQLVACVGVNAIGRTFVASRVDHGARAGRRGSTPRVEQPTTSSRRRPAVHDDGRPDVRAAQRAPPPRRRAGSTRLVLVGPFVDEAHPAPRSGVLARGSSRCSSSGRWCCG